MRFETLYFCRLAHWRLAIGSGTSGVRVERQRHWSFTQSSQELANKWEHQVTAAMVHGICFRTPHRAAASYATLRCILPIPPNMHSALYLLTILRLAPPNRTVACIVRGMSIGSSATIPLY